MNTIKQIEEENGKGIHSMFNACMHKAECCSKDAEIAELKRKLEKVNDAGLSKEDIDYPLDVFNSLIFGNSPYAFYLFQWVPYQTDAQKWRLKMLHDVKTFDGREAIGIWPNGSSCGPFKDSEVEFIRISKKQYGAEWIDPRKSSSKAAIGQAK